MRRQTVLQCQSGIGVLVTLLPSFLAGLMFGGMKNVIEQHCPVINRINPASVLSDAFYCLSVYDDAVRYRRCILILVIMCLLCISFSFLMIGGNVMTVFKGFLIITKRNLLMVFMYLAIFLTIGILASGSDSNTSGTGFHAQALTVGVIDHDGGVLSKGLSTYLSQYHTVRHMPDDTAKLQDALFNRNVSYIVTIPKDFKASCLREHQHCRYPRFREAQTGTTSINRSTPI